ncbi:MAG: CDP-alcohol phosphatidyltransferase family protein [Ardenticatenaceae bacterium]|nr:CDP-alcohol phosphatidyltransferase family protein [Ardenticatenaceae bacterium]
MKALTAVKTMVAVGDNEFRLRRKVAAWGIHLLTASGVVLGFLAILAIFEGQWQIAMALMLITTIIDGFDGALSRLVRVKEVLPGFDGALLDNIVDFMTYVLVPAIFIFQANLVPEAWLVVVPAIILLSSSYQFAQEDAKTEDHFFKGFPSYWNIVIIYFVLLGTSPIFNLAVLLACGIMVFVPIKYLYPSRMTVGRGITVTLTVLWVGVMGLLIWQYPMLNQWLIGASLFYVAYYVIYSLYANVRPLTKRPLNKPQRRPRRK